MVAEYTNRKLTFATNKFSALSGLASAVAEHDQGKYLAGIWWEDVAFGICWKNVSLLSKHDDYIASSWSWASVEGPIEFIDALEVYFSQIRLTLMTPVIFHDFHVEPWGSNKYGRVKDDGSSLRHQWPPSILQMARHSRSREWKVQQRKLKFLSISTATIRGSLLLSF